MIRGALSLLVALALAACGEEAKRADLPPPSPALWQVTAPDGKPAGWLFGTIHSLPDGAEWRTPALDKAIVDADLLVVEAKDLEDSGKLAATFTRLSHTPDMPPLSTRVPESLQGNLRKLLAKGGYREADFKAVETWAAAIVLAVVGASISTSLLLVMAAPFVTIAAYEAGAHRWQEAQLNRLETDP